MYYAATEMEARMCGASPVVVVGGGNSAGQAAIFLSQGGCPVTLVIRGPDLGRSMSRYLVDRIEADPHITSGARTTVVALRRGRDATGRASQRTRRRDDRRRAPDCSPSSERSLPLGGSPGAQPLTNSGFVLTDLSLTPDQLGDGWEALARSPLPFETSHPGLFAVGDLRSGSTKRVAAAVGEGSAAVRSVHQYLAFAA